MSYYPTPKISHPSNDTCRWESHFWRRPEDTEDTGSSFPQPLIRKRREVGHLSPHAEQVAKQEINSREETRSPGQRTKKDCSVFFITPQKEGPTVQGVQASHSHHPGLLKHLYPLTQGFRKFSPKSLLLEALHAVSQSGTDENHSHSVVSDARTGLFHP